MALYPSAPPLQEPTLPTVHESALPTVHLSDKYYESQVAYLDDKVKSIANDKLHCIKLRRRWSNFSTILRHSSIVLVGGLETTGVILMIFPVTGFIAPIVIGASGFVEMIASEFINSFISKKLKRIIIKIKLDEEYVNKLFHFTQAALKDKIFDESESFALNTLLKEYNDKRYPTDPNKEAEIKPKLNTAEFSKNLESIMQQLKSMQK